MQVGNPAIRKLRQEACHRFKGQLPNLKKKLKKPRQADVVSAQHLVGRHKALGLILLRQSPSLSSPLLPSPSLTSSLFLNPN